MNAKTIKYILLIIVSLVFIGPIWDILSGYSEALKTFGSERGVERSYPVVVFVTQTLTVLMVILLLFTPGRQNVSPLSYFMDEFSKKIYLYLNYNDKNIDNKGFETKNGILASLLIDFVVGTIMTVTYYFILKKVNQPEFSYLYMLFYLIFIYIIISFNSWITTLIERTELMLSEGKDQQDGLTYIQKKNIYTIALIIITILIVTGGEVLSKDWANSLKSKNLPIIKWFATEIKK